MKSQVKVAKFIIGAKSPSFSKEEKERIINQKPSPNAIKLLLAVSKAKVVVKY